jgi:Prophage antirepressor
MTTELTVFNFDQDTNIRTVMINGEPHFVAKDICDALGIKDNKDAIRTLRTNYESIGINADKIVSNHPISDSIGRLQGTIIVTESGLYDLIAQSRKPNALKFKYWISSEVLPSIQKKDDNIPNKMMIITEKEILGKIVTVYGTPESPLFLAIEVAEWIEYDITSVNKLVNLVDDSEKVRNIVPTLGGNQEMWFLTEDGLYEVLMQSQKPIAKQFKSKVKEILKDIRKNGFYGTESFVDMALNNTDNLIVILQKYKFEKQHRLFVEQQRDEAIRTKSWISRTREATAMATASVFSLN